MHCIRLAFPAFVLVTLLAAQPVAAAGSCGDGLSVADVTINSAAASDCQGTIAGNDTLPGINALGWGDDWTFLAKNESTPPATFMGIAYTLDTSGSQSGTWTLTAHDLDAATPLGLPVELDVVVVLKASNRHAAYFFDDAVFDGSDGGAWSTAFLNHGGQVPDLSHMSFYARIDEDGGIPSAIPEASTTAMLVAGLALVGFATRRRA